MARVVSESAKSDIGASIAIALLSLTYALSYGALLFSAPDLTPFINFTISAAIITTIVTVIVVALFSDIKFAIAGPDSNTVAVLASLIIMLVANAPDDMQGRDLAIFTLTAMCLVTIVTGLIMYLMGRFNLANFIRFVPVSVAGGFLAAAGILMMNGALFLATGMRPISIVTESLGGLELFKLSGLLGFALFFWVATEAFKSQLALPIAIFTAIFAVHATLLAKGISLEEAQDMGLLINAGGNMAVFFPPVDAQLNLSTMTILLGYIPEMIIIVVVTALSILLIIAGIELDRNIDSDLNQELKVHGYAIGLSGLTGGFIGLVSLSRSLLNAEKRSRFPVAALLTTLLCGSVFIFGTSFISLLPQTVLGGMVLFLGAQITYRWLVTTYSTVDRNEYILILIISLTTLYAGFISGLVLGVVAGCILFAARASFVSVVRQELSGEAYRSRVVRSPDEEVYLRDLNKSIRIYELQGFLFFGTAHNFYTKIKRELENGDAAVRHIILSFKHVSGVDASAEQILQKIFLAADKYNCGISTIEMPQHEQITVARLLRRSPTLIADHNYAAIYDAMEAIEENFLRELEVEGAGASLASWLETRLENAESAAALFKRLSKAIYQDGDVICRQGEDADEIFFLDTGRIDVVSNDVPGHPFRIYSFMRHTMLGEMGFIRHETRSADLIARGETVVYSLTRSDYEALQGVDDLTVTALLQLVSVTLSDRMISANRTIAELQA